MKIITINIPDWYIEIMDILAREKKYQSRSEFARVAIDHLLAHNEKKVFSEFIEDHKKEEYN